MYSDALRIRRIFEHEIFVISQFFFSVFAQGRVEITIAGGRVVWENGELMVVPGSGKYIEMRPFSYLFDGIDKADANYLSSLQAPVKRFRAES